MSNVYKRLKRGWDYLQRRFKESITIKHITAITLSTHDVPTETVTTTVTSAIVYNTADEFLQQPFGDLAKGDYIFLLDEAETVSERDTIVYNSIDYEIMGIEPLNTQGGEVGKLARCKRRTD